MSILKIDPELLKQMVHKKAAKKVNEKKKQPEPEVPVDVAEPADDAGVPEDPVEEVAEVVAAVAAEPEKKRKRSAPKKVSEPVDKETVPKKRRLAAQKPVQKTVKKPVEKTPKKPAQKKEPAPKLAQKRNKRSDENMPRWFLNYINEGKRIEPDPVKAEKTASDAWEDAKQRAKISSREQTHQHRMYNMIFGR